MMVSTGGRMRWVKGLDPKKGKMRKIRIRVP